MVERRTFIVRFHARDPPILEDVATGERVRLPDVRSLAGEIERRLDHPAYGDHQPALIVPRHKP